MDWIHKISWGDAPTWGAALFTALAAIAAWKTLRSQRKQIDEQRTFIGEQSANLALERAEMLAASKERREAQARQILFLGKSPSYIKIWNNSKSPITDVHCEVDGVPAQRATTVDPGDSVAATLIANTVQGTAQAHLDKLGVDAYGWFLVEGAAHGEALLSFTDAAGNRWTRDRAGGLEQITS